MTETTKIEYRVLEHTRYSVTRYESTEYTDKKGEVHQEGASTQIGDYVNASNAYDVAYALCQAEHRQLGWGLDDERIQYPRNPEDLTVTTHLTV